MLILAALLSLHSPLATWAGEAVAARWSVEDAQGADQTQIVHLVPSANASPQPGEASAPRAAVAAKAPLLALVPTLALNSESGASPTPSAMRRTAAMPSATAAEKWQLAPIRLWGDLAYDFRRTSLIGQSASTSHAAIANVSASTYIYEPWVAIVSARLGLSLSRLNDGELVGGDRFLTGDARLNIFPASRFPFEARYLRSDIGTDTDLGADQRARLTRYGVSQRYRNEEGSQQYSASFDRSTQDGASVGRDIQSALQFDASTRFRSVHDLQLMATWNQNRRINTAERNGYETLLARHAFRPNSTLSLENSVNLTHTDFRFGSAESDLRIFQLSSIAFWRPESQPLTVNGSVRMFSLDSGKDSIGTRVVNASAGANYTFNRNLRALAGISLTDTNSSGGHNRTGSGSLGVNYQGNSIEWNKYRYDWFAGATGVSTSGDTERNGISLNAILGQSLSRGFIFGNGSALTFNAAQNVSVNTGAQVEASKSGSKQLSHAGSVTWNTNEPESGATSFIRLSATDSRYLDGQRETFQLVNLQLTRTLALGHDRALSGNLTVQTTRRVSKRPGFENSGNEGRPETSVSADLSYRHQNLFGVPRLLFFSQLQVNRQEVIQAFGTQSQRELLSWENRLDYQIGRLETRFLIRFSEFDGTKYSLVMFRATRRF